MHEANHKMYNLILQWKERSDDTKRKEEERPSHTLSVLSPRWITPVEHFRCGSVIYGSAAESSGRTHHGGMPGSWASGGGQHLHGQSDVRARGRGCTGTGSDVLQSPGSVTVNDEVDEKQLVSKCCLKQLLIWRLPLRRCSCLFSPSLVIRNTSE